MQLKNLWSGSKTTCDFFYYFSFQRNYDILQSKSPCILLNENKDRKSKVKLMSWSSWKKKEDIFCTFFLFKGNFSNICFIWMHSVLNTLSEYTYFYMSKNITSYTFCLSLKLSKALSVSLKLFWLFINRILWI